VALALTTSPLRAAILNVMGYAPDSNLSPSLRRWIAIHMADSATGQRKLSVQRPEFRLRHTANDATATFTASTSPMGNR
jgi:hypothetical protein